jgi:hypothetical protein
MNWVGSHSHEGVEADATDRSSYNKRGSEPAVTKATSGGADGQAHYDRGRTGGAPPLNGEEGR